MQILPTPLDVMRMIGISLAQIGGSKKKNEAAWRRRQRAFAGKTENPNWESMFPDAFANGMTLDELEHWTDWRCFFEGTQRGVEPWLPILREEVFRIEKEGPPSSLFGLPSLSGLVSRGQSAGSGVLASGARVVVILHLLACYEADHVAAPSLVELLLPRSENGGIKRPMSLWMDAVRAEHPGLSMGEVADIILMPRKGQREEEDRETSRRLVRKFANGEIPPWRRVPYMVKSLAQEKSALRNVPEAAIYVHMAIVRLLDALLAECERGGAKGVWLDPLTPFADYPQICERIRSRGS